MLKQSGLGLFFGLGKEKRPLYGPRSSMADELSTKVNESGIYQQWVDENLELANSLGLQTN